MNLPKHARLGGLGESLPGVGHPLTSQQREIGRYQYVHTLLEGAGGGDQAGNPLPRKKFTFPWFSAGDARAGSSKEQGWA